MSYFRSEFFKAEGDVSRLACLVVGFTGKISQYRRAIDALLAEGYDVIAFEYDNAILDTGEPRLLPELVDGISDSLKTLLPTYTTVMCTGVSLGAYIAINIQRKLAQVSLGVYGTAGVPVSHVVFNARVFYKIKRAFLAKGYTEETLRAAWQQTDETDKAGFYKGQSLLIVLGKQDRILPHKTAVKVLKGWKDQGVNVDYFSLRGRGHSMTIGWYKNHLGGLLQRAKSLTP